MSEFAQLRSVEKSLEALRADLVKKIDATEGDTRTLDDLHRRVSKALKALSCNG